MTRANDRFVVSARKFVDVFAHEFEANFCRLVDDSRGAFAYFVDDFRESLSFGGRE